MTPTPIRLISTGIRKEWVGWRFQLYAMALGGEFRRKNSAFRDNSFELLYVPENEWLALIDEYMLYTKETDGVWKPIGNRWNSEHGLLCVEAYVA